MTYELECFNGSLTSRINKSGPVYRLSFEIHKDAYVALTDADLANGLFTFALIQHDANGLPPESKGGHWDQLIRKGFFYNPHLLETLGGDKEFCHFLRRQPSAISNEFSEYINGEGRCVVAHVRRASNSGTGYKPKFSALPLTVDEHAAQHQHGEEHLKPKSWWDNQVAKHIVKFVKHRLKQIFLVESLKDIAFEDFAIWCNKNNLELPNVEK